MNDVITFLNSAGIPIAEYLVVTWFLGMIISLSVADNLGVEKRWQRILAIIGLTITAPFTLPPLILFGAAAGIIYLAFIATVALWYIAILGIGVYVFVVVIGFMAKIAFG